MSLIAIGPSGVEMVSFSEPGVLAKVPPPKTLLIEGAEATMNAGGYTRWLGYPRIVWRWEYLEPEWYDALRSVCPEDSDDAWARSTTNDNNDEIQTFMVIYSWPLELDKDFKVRREFEMILNRAIEILVEIAPDPGALTISPQDLTVVVGLSTRSLNVGFATATGRALQVFFNVNLAKASASASGQPITVVLT